jgi:hypothetical protein
MFLSIYPSIYLSVYLSICCGAGIELRPLHMLGKRPTTELPQQLLFTF